MKPIALIIRRELGAYLRSPFGWVIAAVALLLEGLAFNFFAMGDTARKSAEVLAKFFFWTGGFSTAAGLFLSMRLVAEERQTGTIALLYSSPIRDYQIVLGKFLASFLFLIGIVAATFYMPMLITWHGKINVGQVLAGYLGVLLMAGSGLAIGLFSSTLTKNQVIAIVVGAAITLFLLFCWLIASAIERPLSEVFSWLALYNKHFPPFERGIINTQDVVYYLSVMYFFLFGATRVLESRRWSS